MDRSRKTCFVICPIGSDASPARARANDLFELILEPTLERYEFKVFRADRLPRSSVITTDIVQLVQSADLCIIDLSDRNPNVFYECGRRHETGKPFIQLLEKGQDLPFDLASIRTIFYDLTSPRTVHAVTTELRLYLDELSAAGWSASSPGVSLSSIADTLGRIERKLTRLDSLAIPASGTVIQSDISRDMVFRHPRQVFVEAVDAANLDLAVQVLPRLVTVLGSSAESVHATILLTRAGYQQAANILRQLIESGIDQIDDEDLTRAVGTLVAFYTMANREQEALEWLAPILENSIERHSDTPSWKAFFLNQRQKLVYGTGDYQRALADAEMTVALCPTDPSYAYNLSMIYEGLDRFDRAAESMDRCLSLMADDTDEDYLAQAVEMYCRAGRVDDARTVFAQLQDSNPRRAATLRSVRDLRDCLATG